MIGLTLEGGRGCHPLTPCYLSIHLPTKQRYDCCFSSQTCTGFTPAPMGQRRHGGMAEHSPAAGGKASYMGSVPRSCSQVLPSPGTTEWQLCPAWPEPASLWVFEPALKHGLDSAPRQHLANPFWAVLSLKQLYRI